MINVFKRIVLILIIIAFFFGCFFAYKKYSKDIDKRKSFTFWSIQLKPIYEKQIDEIISDFESKHPDYKVVWVDIPIQEAQKRTLASILSSTVPDLINLNPDFSLVLAQKNALEYFSEDELKDFNLGLVNKLRYKNKIYGIPFYATSPVTIYNKEIFDKCSINNFPNTYDELYSISDKLYLCSHSATFAGALNENDTLLKILNKYDVSLFKNQNEKENAFMVYSMFDDMYKKGYLPKDILSVNHREVIEKYMSNQALVIVAGSNFIKMIKQNAPDIYKKSEIAPQLTGSNGKYDVSLMNFVIPKKSKNKELAREFALLLTNEKNQLELAQLTNVLPANKYALSNDYFKICPSDLNEKSRCESSKQLDNLISDDTEIKDKKALNENLNKFLEQILLDKNSNSDFIKAGINNLFSRLNLYIEQN